jgi:iron-sulfur cluster repair protein YtfE (RIC family)
MSEDDQPGLRLRLAHESRRIAGQHAWLASVESTVLRVLERGTPGEAREALRAYQGSLDAHFELEERIHFPALHGLRPELGERIAALVVDHGRLRRALDELADRVGSVPRDAVTAGFRDVTLQLGEHEQREETLLDGNGSPSDATVNPLGE